MCHGLTLTCLHQLVTVVDAMKAGDGNPGNMAMVVDGVSIFQLFENKDEAMIKSFLDICRVCKAGM